MKCEICHENEASLVLKQVVEGSVREVAICPVCAAANSLGLELGSELFPDPAAPDLSLADAATCPACGMSVADLHRRSRLGCEQCYTAFDSQLLGLLMELQPATQHAGRIPAAEKIPVERHSLQARLNKAVTLQDFETAACMRDRIAALAPPADGEPDGSR
jgi:protein arginine kinase activator